MPGAADTREADRQEAAALALCFYQLTAGRQNIQGMMTHTHSHPNLGADHCVNVQTIRNKGGK